MGQRFEVDVEIMLDLAPAGREDDLSKTINYAEVYAVVENVLTGPPLQLIEAVAERVARDILGSFPVQRVMVRVKKPGAPVPGNFDFMAAEIERGR